MPILNDASLEQQTLPNSHYGYSATRLEELGATAYTVVTVACDVSGSTAAFAFEMEAAVARIVQPCKSSPRADNLLLPLLAFADTTSAVLDFKLWESCSLVDYAS